MPKTQLPPSSSSRSPSLPFLLPPRAIPLSSPLSLDDREVLSYLLLLLRLHFPPPPPPSKHQPWKHAFSSPPPSSSFHSSLPRPPPPFPNASTFPAPSCENPSCCPEVCDCFSCYSPFWSRWNASPNRDVINAILEIVEVQEMPVHVANAKGRCDRLQNLTRETGSKKGKRRSEKKKTDANILQPSLIVENDLESCVEEQLQETVNSSPASAVQQVSRAASKRSVSKRKGKGTKNRALPEERDVLALPNEAALLSISEVESTKEGDGNGSLRSVADTAGCGSLQMKNGPRHQRAGKRRNNQVIPLDCEAPPDQVGEEQEFSVPINDENTEGSTSMRVTDISLRGRGFFTHVFIGSVGGVASRLWDLVSLGFGSRGIDYY